MNLKCVKKVGLKSDKYLYRKYRQLKGRITDNRNNRQTHSYFVTVTAEEKCIRTELYLDKSGKGCACHKCDILNFSIIKGGTLE